MAASLLPVMMVVGIAAALCADVPGAQSGAGAAAPFAPKTTTYECGIPPRGSTEIRFFVRFFLIALLFLLFDLEAVFLYPWVILYRSFLAEGRALFALGEMAVFLVILLAGYAYVWRKGGLEWQ